MKKVIYLIAGLLIGAILMVTVIWNKMPGLMLLNMESKHDFETTVDKLVIGAFDTGWEVINEVDIQDRLILSDYGDILRMRIIEICHADHSYTIFQDDENKKVAALMPCRFAVYETHDGKVMVSKMNIGLMSKMFGGVIQQVMGTVAEEEKLMLKDVIK
ncbi:MAG: DUF302 domain-containing protein [Candidatus Cloacimonetes bacterium]|nr:DUF302 domain-containing protein [Candidatus Cloacimonadota bacterium]